MDAKGLSRAAPGLNGDTLFGFVWFGDVLSDLSLFVAGCVEEPALRFEDEHATGINRHG